MGTDADRPCRAPQDHDRHSRCRPARQPWPSPGTCTTRSSSAIHGAGAAPRGALGPDVRPARPTGQRRGHHAPTSAAGRAAAERAAGGLRRIPSAACPLGATEPCQVVPDRATL